MIFDTHAHCYWDTLEPRIDEVIAHMQQNGVDRVTQIGCDIPTSEQAIALARRFPGVFYATVGLHPETAQDTATENNEQGDLGKSLEGLIQENRDIVVAVGECGLDFHYLDGTDGGKSPIDRDHLTKQAREQIENQKYWWKTQWQIAQQYDLPLVIHTRDARDETLDFMQENAITRCVMHCYSEDWDFARTLLEFSSEIYFSFSGILTYKSAQKIQEAAQKLPIDRILVETDAPFLAPQPVRGQVCEPAFTRYTLDRLAELRGVRTADIEEHVYNNSLRFFGIKK